MNWHCCWFAINTVDTSGTYIRTSAVQYPQCYALQEPDSRSVSDETSNFGTLFDS